MATLYQIPSPVFSENWMFIETEPKLVYHLNEIIRKELIGDFTLCILFLLNISLFLIYNLLFSVE